MRKGNRRPAYPTGKKAVKPKPPTGKTIRWKRPPYPKGWARTQIAYHKAKPQIDRDDLQYSEKHARFLLGQKLMSDLSTLRHQLNKKPIGKTIRWRRKQ